MSKALTEDIHHLGMTRWLPVVQQWSTRASLVGAMVGSLALAAGCASLVDTSAQELARSRWTVCHARVTGTELDTVQRDGRISFWYSGAGESQTMLECLREAAKMGPDLPEPIAQLRPGGSGGGGGAM